MIGLGLSRANCKKLLEGKPIFIDLKVMMMDVVGIPNFSDGTILIFGGETEATMQRDIERGGGKFPVRHEHFEEN